MVKMCSCLLAVLCLMIQGFFSSSSSSSSSDSGGCTDGSVSSSDSSSSSQTNSNDCNMQMQCLQASYEKYFDMETAETSQYEVCIWGDETSETCIKQNIDTITNVCYDEFTSSSSSSSSSYASLSYASLSLSFSLSSSNEIVEEWDSGHDNKICNIVPCGEMVVFGIKNGNDCSNTAPLTTTINGLDAKCSYKCGYCDDGCYWEIFAPQCVLLPTSNPSEYPSSNPSNPSSNPSLNPSSNPSSNPSDSPSLNPTVTIIYCRPQCGDGPCCIGSDDEMDNPDICLEGQGSPGDCFQIPETPMVTEEHSGCHWIPDCTNACLEECECESCAENCYANATVCETELCVGNWNIDCAFNASIPTSQPTTMPTRTPSVPSTSPTEIPTTTPSVPSTNPTQMPTIPTQIPTQAPTIGELTPVITYVPSCNTSGFANGYDPITRSYSGTNENGNCSYTLSDDVLIIDPLSIAYCDIQSRYVCVYKDKLNISQQEQYLNVNNTMIITLLTDICLMPMLCPIIRGTIYDSLLIDQTFSNNHPNSTIFNTFGHKDLICVQLWDTDITELFSEADCDLSNVTGVVLNGSYIPYIDPVVDPCNATSKNVTERDNNNNTVVELLHSPYNHSQINRRRLGFWDVVAPYVPPVLKPAAETVVNHVEEGVEFLEDGLDTLEEIGNDALDYIEEKVDEAEEFFGDVWDALTEISVGGDTGQQKIWDVELGPDAVPGLQGILTVSLETAVSVGLDFNLKVNLASPSLERFKIVFSVAEELFRLNATVTGNIGVYQNDPEFRYLVFEKVFYQYTMMWPIGPIMLTGTPYIRDWIGVWFTSSMKLHTSVFFNYAFKIGFDYNNDEFKPITSFDANINATYDYTLLKLDDNDCFFQLGLTFWDEFEFGLMINGGLMSTQGRFRIGTSLTYQIPEETCNCSAQENSNWKWRIFLEPIASVRLFDFPAAKVASFANKLLKFVLGYVLAQYEILRTPHFEQGIDFNFCSKMPDPQGFIKDIVALCCNDSATPAPFTADIVDGGPEFGNYSLDIIDDFFLCFNQPETCTYLQETCDTSMDLMCCPDLECDVVMADEAEEKCCLPESVVDVYSCSDDKDCCGAESYCNTNTTLCTFPAIPE